MREQERAQQRRDYLNTIASNRILRSAPTRASVLVTHSARMGRRMRDHRTCVCAIPARGPAIRCLDSECASVLANVAGLMVFRESELLERFRAGDEEALEIVYRACVDHVTRIADAVLRACAMGTGRAAGDIAAVLVDVVQEVFMKAFAPDARRRFDSSRPYEPYLGQIARNVAVDHWRQMRRYVPSDVNQLIDRLSLELEADSAHANDWADADTVALVNRYLASLDEESRRVHDALYVKGLSQRDAAEMLGIGRQVIRTKEAKLRRDLRRELLARGRGETVSIAGQQRKPVIPQPSAKGSSYRG